MAVLMHSNEKIKIIRQPKALVAVVLNFTHQARKCINGLVNLLPVRAFSEKVTVGVESQPAECFDFSQNLGQIVVNPLDLQLDGIQYIHKVVFFQIGLNHCCCLSDLPNSFAKISILGADVPNELFKFLNLNLLHSLNTPVVDERAQFRANENIPIEMLMNEGEAQNLAFEGFRVEVIQERACAGVASSFNFTAALVSCLCRIRKFASSARTVERRWINVFAVKESPFLEKAHILPKPIDCLLITLQLRALLCKLILASFESRDCLFMPILKLSVAFCFSIQRFLDIPALGLLRIQRGNKLVLHSLKFNHLIRVAFNLCNRI